MSDTKKDTAKVMRKVSRKQNPLPQAKIVSPNKKAYKRKPKSNKHTDCCAPERHIGWPEWWMD